ncbi:hypothetical protein ACFSZS_17480 [Seohaeicola zhoushanensis]
MEARNESSLLPVPPPVEFAERVVLFIDMVSYSRHIGLDEAATLEFMAGCFDSFRILSRRFNGTLVKTLGDGALLLFDGAVDAISFGVEFQNIVADRQTGTPDPFMFRVGLHLGTFSSGMAMSSAIRSTSPPACRKRPGQAIASSHGRSSTRSARKPTMASSRSARRRCAISGTRSLCTGSSISGPPIPTRTRRRFTGSRSWAGPTAFSAPTAASSAPMRGRSWATSCSVPAALTPLTGSRR